MRNWQRPLGTTFVLLVLLAAARPAPGQQAEKPGEKATEDVREFVYKKTKQGELRIHVHYPPGWKKEDKRPAIVFFFGGGWNQGRVEQFEPQAKYLASRGMVA